MTAHRYHDHADRWIAVCDVDGCDWRRDGLSFDEATTCVNAHQAYHRVRAAVAAQEAINSVIDQIRNGPTLPPAGSDARGGAGDVPVARPADHDVSRLMFATVTFVPPSSMTEPHIAREALHALAPLGVCTIEVDGIRYRLQPDGRVRFERLRSSS